MEWLIPEGHLSDESLALYVDALLMDMQNKLPEEILRHGDAPFTQRSKPSYRIRSTSVLRGKLRVTTAMEARITKRRSTDLLTWVLRK